MKVKEIHNKAMLHRESNFGGKDSLGQFTFVNGVPASKVQRMIHEFLSDFELNFYDDDYYYDLFNKEKNIIIEYNGRGHDLCVRMGKETRENFIARELTRKNSILEKKIRLLIIQDSKDKMLKEKTFQRVLSEVYQFIDSSQIYNEIILE